MSDYGIFRSLQKTLNQVHPHLKVMSQLLPDEKTPYILLQKGIFERKLPPFKTGFQKITLVLVSRFKGDAEIQELYQKTCTVLEGMNLMLEEGISGQIILEDSHFSLEKDNLTRTARINFTMRLKFQ